MPMKYCLKFEEETSTPRHCLLGAEQALQLLDCLSSSPCVAIQALLVLRMHKIIFQKGWGGGGGGGALALIALPLDPPLLTSLAAGAAAFMHELG